MLHETLSLRSNSPPPSRRRHSSRKRQWRRTETRVRDTRPNTDFLTGARRSLGWVGGGREMMMTTMMMIIMINTISISYSSTFGPFVVRTNVYVARCTGWYLFRRRRFVVARSSNTKKSERTARGHRCNAVNERATNGGGKAGGEERVYRASRRDVCFFDRRLRPRCTLSRDLIQTRARQRSADGRKIDWF